MAAQGFRLAAGVAVLVYGLVGVFGAARFGRDTAGDILVNTWLGGRAEGFLDLAVTAYLAISMPPVQVQLFTWAGTCASCTGWQGKYGAVYLGPASPRSPLPCGARA